MGALRFFGVLSLSLAVLLPAAFCQSLVITGEYVPGSTRRITTLTGPYDPEGWTHINNTIPWGVSGVDLGANTDDDDGNLYFFFGDVPDNHDYDLVAYTKDAYPGTSGMHLTPVLGPDGKFDPFKIRIGGAGPGMPLGTNNTPTGAFSYYRRMYVFAFWTLCPSCGSGCQVANCPQTCPSECPATPYGIYSSDLTRSLRPSLPPCVYDRVFVMSGGGEHASAKFSQVAPYVVQNSKITGLPSAVGDGVIMFGNDHNEGMYLAWMPLVPGRDPEKAQIRYWTGNGWSNPGEGEDKARLLFPKRGPKGWTSISVGRMKETGAWVFLYQTSTRKEDGPGVIIARVAATPWELAKADDLVIFDPNRDDPGHVLHQPGGFAYGAYLLNRYTSWDDDKQTAYIWYLMSTFDPYQVHLMHSGIKLKVMQFSGTFSSTPPGYQPIWVYVLTEADMIGWARKESSTSDWQGPRPVGAYWPGSKTILPAGGNSLYGITQDGVLKWYRHNGFNDGSALWQGPVNISTGWQNFTKVFSGGDGILYAIQPDGTLLWYRHNGFASGGGSDTLEGPKTVGDGWSGFTHVFSMGQGIIYAVQPDGTLLWYQHKGFATGTPSWSGAQTVGSGWDVFRDIVAAGDGIILASRPDGKLFWYKHTDYETGTTLERGPSGGRLGRLATSRSAHWEGPIEIGKQGWERYKTFTAILPSTHAGPN